MVHPGTAPAPRADLIDGRPWRMRVLIVEDDFVGSRLMKKFLEADCFCHLAFDGREAIEAFDAALREGKP